MKSKKIFILLGHPDAGPEPMSRQLADAYEAAARAAGHEVRRTNIFDLSFDPVLHKGYRAIQELEPDLKAVQENISWCEHFIIFHPNWWGGMPALLKGLWDRLFLPRFAFRMWKSRMGWTPMLKGRSARIVVTCGNPAILDYLAFGDFTASLKRSLLQFAGFRTRVTTFGLSETSPDKKKESWKRKIASYGKRGI
ncbi:MAG: NADPH-dependent FMN reductase [Parcubacteria bacterium C7867-004]|nr:MAG: NADPH-dependent FMN reductase [Parcubacteria bacterium C7867-004]